MVRVKVRAVTVVRLVRLYLRIHTCYPDCPHSRSRWSSWLSGLLTAIWCRCQPPSPEGKLHIPPVYSAPDPVCSNDRTEQTASYSLASLANGVLPGWWLFSCCVYFSAQQSIQASHQNYRGRWWSLSAFPYSRCLRIVHPVSEARRD